MKEIKKTMRTFFLLSGLTTFAHGLIASNYMLYLLEADLSQLEANLVNLAFFFCVFLFEIPTGLIADIFGRKVSVLLSYFIMGISMFFYGFSNNIMGFMIAEAIAAVALTLESGAFDAWIIDELKGLGSKKKIDKLFGDRQIVTAIFGIFGTVIGAVAYDINKDYAWLLAGITMTITFICGTVIMKERFFEKTETSIKEKLIESKQIVKKSISLAKNSRAISFLMIIGVSMAFILQAPNMFWQPFFGNDLENSKQLSILWVGVMMSLIIGGKMAPLLLKKLDCERKSLISLAFFTGSGIIIMSATSILGIMISGFILHEITRAMTNPIRTKYLNDNVPSKERATLNSFESAFRVLGGALGLIFFGILVGQTSYTQSLLISGSLLILISLVFFLKNGFKRMPQSELAREEIT